MRSHMPEAEGRKGQGGAIPSKAPGLQLSILAGSKRHLTKCHTKLLCPPWAPVGGRYRGLRRVPRLLLLSELNPKGTVGVSIKSEPRL